MSPRNEDFLFAQEAQNKGYVTEEQVEEAFLLQRRMAEELKIDERLAVILVKRGWMAEDQARRVYALLEPEGKRIQIEGYKLVERVGRGSMGTVYKAIHKGLHRVVAIKVLRRELLGEKVHTERLKNEARMLAELEHPNIVRALDAGESNGFPYVVMEYVEGETLKDRIARKGPLAEDEALRIARGIADALERARRMGVVHRDVKPGNILISDRGVAKLMDLGLAKGPVDLELTQHGATVGTPQFMAPEQVEEAGGVDCRSDIYGLGATLYAMLTGVPPFTAGSMAEILNKVLNEQPIPIRARNKLVSPEVSYLVERMMLKDPSLRYQVPAAVVDHVDRILGGQSIIPQGFQGNWEGYLLKERLRRRNRRLVIGGVALVLALLGGYLTWDYSQRMDAHEREATTIEQILTESAVNENMRRDDLQRKLGRVEKLREELKRERALGGRTAVVPPEIEREIDRLRRYEKRWNDYDVLAVRTDELVRRLRFGDAHRQLVAFRETIGGYRALDKEVGANMAEVARASVLAVDSLVRRAKDIAAKDIDEYARRFRAISNTLAQGDFVERRQAPGGGSPLATARRKLAALSGQLETVRGAVAGVEGAYGDATVDARIRAGERVGLMRQEIELEVGNVKRVVETSLRADAWTEGFRREPIVQLVQGQLDDLIERFEGLVREWGAEMLRKARDQLRTQDYAQAEATLDALLQSVGTTWFSDLRVPGEGLDREVQSALREFKARRRDLRLTTAQRVAELLRRGEVARAGRTIDQALLEKAAEEPVMGASLRALRHGLDAVEALWTASLGYLAGRGRDVRFDDVPVYDEDWKLAERPLERFKVGHVDLAARTLTTRVYAEGRYVDRVYEARRFPYSQHRRWAEAGRQSLEPMHEALVRLFDVTMSDWRTRANLRPVLRELEHVLGVFEDTPGFEAWREFTEYAEEVVRKEQIWREAEAIKLRRRAKRWQDEGDAVPALDEYRKWLDPDAPWRFTDDFDRHADDVRQAMRACEAAAAKREIERWLKGFRAEELPNGWTRLRCGFDIPVCLQSFEHGYGRLVSEEGSVVTPGGGESDRWVLELLSGVSGLLPDRPLSLPSMFDPADTIELAFDLDTRKGAFFMAFDLDGVQLGILSADPQWHPSWRLPPSVLREGESDVDFYGRGRGIAWRHGMGFGDVAETEDGKTKWNWTSSQRGRNHVAWEKLGEGSDRLFAFKPGHQYRVRITRSRDRLQLAYADLRRYRTLGEKAFEEVFSRRESAWRGVGTASELAPGQMTKGSGRLQILSWSTVRIDNLELTGRVREAWKAVQRDRNR